MTVKQLIARLAKLDPDKLIMLPQRTNDFLVALGGVNNRDAQIVHLFGRGDSPLQRFRRSQKSGENPEPKNKNIQQTAVNRQAIKKTKSQRGFGPAASK